ncbi:hypothetical protein QBC34DRAFT_379613 [Podospora aff. communis PSN243]|uniref:Uncharacterized protein n=1 Tax=Podospora aff. communis PSN243 TaxID=3040156 RepID=A0AAV9GPS2_9PEZI|nr:hypothetical protein QBC34DRAFT_379613 [Podospora aff. communis PSN243]
MDVLLAKIQGMLERGMFYSDSKARIHQGYHYLTSPILAPLVSWTRSHTSASRRPGQLFDPSPVNPRLHEPFSTQTARKPLPQPNRVFIGRDNREPPPDSTCAIARIASSPASPASPHNTVKLAQNESPYPEPPPQSPLTPPADSELLVAALSKMDEGPQLLPLPPAIETEPISRPSSTSTQTSAQASAPQSIQQSGLPGIAALATASQAANSPQARSVPGTEAT